MRPIYLISKTPYEGVIHIPILTISFFKPDIDFSRYDGIIFTSKQSLIALERYEIPWEKLQCICVSAGTAEAARKAGALNLHIGDGYGRSIPALMERENLKGRWLYVRPKVIASAWIEMIHSEITIDKAILYETTCNENARNYLIDNDAVLVFTSPSSIRCFCDSYPILPTYSIVAIGQTTRDAFKNAKEVHISPETNVASAVELAQKIARIPSAF